MATSPPRRFGQRPLPRLPGLLSPAPSPADCTARTHAGPCLSAQGGRLDCLSVPYLPDRRNVMDYGLRRDSPDAGSPYTLVPRTLSGFTPLVTARIGF
jgi:hypothetical protein